MEEQELGKIASRYLHDNKDEDYNLVLEAVKNLVLDGGEDPEEEKFPKRMRIQLAQLKKIKEAEQKVEEEKKAKEEAEKKVEEERKAKEEAQRKEEEAEMRAKVAEEGTDLYTLTLPEAKREYTSTPSALQDNEHEDASLEVTKLDVLDPPNKTPKHRPLLETAIKEGGYVHYSNEADVTYLVRLYLDALINAGGLGKDIVLSAELYIAKFRPDVVIIYTKSGIPCGVVEVKLPDDKAATAAPAKASGSRATTRSMTKDPSQQQQPKETGPLASERFMGQIFNYLQFLRTLYNVENPFGIMTTYKEWRVCWLKKEKATTRTFEGTATMRYNDSNLHRMIMTALVHMSRPPNTQAKSLHEKVGTYLPLLNEAGITWKQLGKEPTENEFPPKTSKEFMLLAPAGSGSEGKAWIACNTGCKLCVVKTFTVKPKEQDLSHVQTTVDKEIYIWQEVFGVKSVFQVKLSGAPAIVMPRLRLAQEPGKAILSLQDGDEAAVRDAVSKYAQHEKVAEDLKWSHVGFLERNPKDGKPLKKKMAILFDSRPRDHKNKNEAQKIMLEKLRL